MKIALCNIPILWEDPDKNIEHCKSIARGVNENNSGVELMLFPEFFTYGFSVDAGLSEDQAGKSLAFLINCAANNNSAVYASVPVKEGNKVYNRGYFVKPDGSFEYYDKRHLFSYGGENRAFNPGKKRVIVEYGGWRILLQICYDLRFPIWSRNVNLEYDLILYISSWPSARSSVILPLSSARAIENQSYVAFLNRSGSDPDSNYSGENFVLSPKGEFLQPITINVNKHFSVFNLDKDELLSYRKKFQPWRDSDKFVIL